jgi:two-component system NtrC family sensor kinase
MSRGSGMPGIGVTDERKLRAFLDGIPAIVAFLDHDRRHRYVNKHYAAFFGTTQDALLGSLVDDLLGPSSLAELRPHIERALAGESNIWEGWTSPPGLAEKRYVQRVYQPFPGDGGSIEGYLLFIRDLTDLKSHEEQLAAQLAALESSQALNSAVIASALDAIIVIDDKSQVVEFNPAAERTFLYRRSEVLGRPIHELIIPPASRARHIAGMRRYMEGGHSSMLDRRIEIEGMRADGGLFPLELTVTAVPLVGRRMFTAHIRDLSEARKAAAEIEWQREALHQSEKLASFGSLLAGVAHELNNPLSIVIGNLLMLDEDMSASPPYLRNRVGTIQSAAERCARVVRTFLTMARMGKTERRWVDMVSLIESAFDLVGYGLRSNGITVRKEYQSPLPPIWGDGDQLHQVLVNLLVNAQQALEGRPEPRWIEVSARSGPNMLEVRVLDNGPGVPPSIRSRIFDPFFTTKPTSNGSGIGLAVSCSIVQDHGGDLQLDTSPESGACFIIRLPTTPPSDATVPEQDGTCRAEPAQAPPRSLMALVIDDEIEIALLLARAFERAGWICDVAENGRKARRHVEVRDYDAILCDVRMPDCDGPAFLQWLKGIKPHLCECLAFLTGDTLGTAAALFLRDSGCRTIEKPFTPDEILRVAASLAGWRNN